MRTIAIEDMHLGDTITAFPAMRALSDAKFWVGNKDVMTLWDMPEKLCDKSECTESYNIIENARLFSRSGLHMVQTWFWRFGLRIPETWDSGIRVVDGGANHYDVVISPQSHSDCGTGTKQWPYGKWAEVIDRLVAKGLSVAVSGLFQSGNDVKFWSNEKVFMLDSLPLPMLAAVMKEAGTVVTLDNGVGHMAQMIGANHLHIVPNHPTQAVQGWVANRNANGRVIFEDMARLSVDTVFEHVGYALQGGW